MPITLSRILNRLQALYIKLEKPTKGIKSYVLGIEGINLNGIVNNDRINEYNDVVTWLDINSQGLISLGKLYRCTTETGLYYVKNPLNPKGAAYAKLDSLHKEIWQVGSHKNQPNCLIQVGAIAITRDLNRDGTRLGNSPEERGIYGINLHSAPGSDGTSVGKWSAGCTVIPNVGQKNELVNHLKLSTNSRFSYILLDGSKL